MENSGNNFSSGGGGLNLKATELRLGLPGSESPERQNGKNSQLTSIGLNINNNSNNKSSVSDAKKGFSVANWVFSDPHFSPTSGSNSGPVLKDGLLRQSPNAVILQEKKNNNSNNNNNTNNNDNQVAAVNGHAFAPASRAQVVGWPPIRSFRKNTMASNSPKNDDDAEAKLGSGCLYVKVSMDGAPYLRKVDLKTYGSYLELSSALEKMFSCFTIGQCGSHGVPSREGLSESRLIDLLHGSEYVLTYEDKDGDWMLVGDVPWKMFTDSCRRLRIMKSSEATGLAPRAMEKCRSHN